MKATNCSISSLRITLFANKDLDIFCMVQPFRNKEDIRGTNFVNKIVCIFLHDKKNSNIEA